MLRVDLTQPAAHFIYIRTVVQNLSIQPFIAVVQLWTTVDGIQESEVDSIGTQSR